MKKIFYYTDAVTIQTEIVSEKDVNALRSFVRAGRFSETDAALMTGIVMAEYSNRYNIERYMLLQKSFKVASKRYFLANFSKLVDAGFLVRLYASYGDHTESPRIYAPSVASCALLPDLLGQKKAHYRPGLPLAPAVTVLAKEAAFQCYVALLSDPVYSAATITLWPKVKVGKFVSTPAMCVESKTSCIYVLVVRRQQEHLDRALTDAQALFTVLSASGKHGAILFVCEDALHMQMVSEVLPSSLRLQPDATLFTHDLSLLEIPNLVPLYHIQTSGGNATLKRTELAPLT